MTTSLLWAYPWDLLDEGLSPALDRITDRAGANGVAVTAVYHAGKFLHPNNPRRKIVFPQSGTLYFPPDRSWYGQLRIRPPVWSSAEPDFWPSLERQARQRGLDLTAWVLCLHNSGVGAAYPDCAVENAFGDRIPTDLCAANPDVGDYLTAVTADIARTRGVDRVLLESLEFMPFQHGYHHEVLGVPVNPRIGLLMSLCFCSHCRAAAHERGVAADRVRHWVAAAVDEHFADPFLDDAVVNWEQLRAGLDGQVGGYLDARAQSVARLTRRVVDGIRSVSDVVVAALDFGPLFPNGPDGRRWESGADLDVLVDLVDELHPTFYFADADLHRSKVDEYLDLVGGDDGVRLLPALRAILPQTGSAADLAAQVDAFDGRVDGVSFYNYGFMARQALDWVRSSMDGFRARRTAVAARN